MSYSIHFHTLIDDESDKTQTNRERSRNTYRKRFRDVTREATPLFPYKANTTRARCVRINGGLTAGAIRRYRRSISAG